MGAAAVRLALADARIGYGAVERAFAGYAHGEGCAGQRALHEVGSTGIPIVNVNNGGASGSTALFLAREAVESGAADLVLAVGFEQMDRDALPYRHDDRPSPLDRSQNAKTLWPAGLNCRLRSDCSAAPDSSI
jgi:acetyl-CoA acetyltransferase